MACMPKLYKWAKASMYDHCNKKALYLILLITFILVLRCREEFTNYMFLERAQEASGTTNENWRLFPQDFKDRNDPGVSHRGMCFFYRA